MPKTKGKRSRSSSSSSSASKRQTRRPKNTRSKHNYSVRNNNGLFAPNPLPYHLMPNLGSTHGKKCKTPKGSRSSRSRDHKKRGKKPTIVFGRLFASWCGACKNSHAEWKKTIKMNKDKKNYDIEESDVAVKIPKFNRKLRPTPPLAAASAYPTYYKMNIKTGILEMYDGSYEQSAINEWLNR